MERAINPLLNHHKIYKKVGNVINPYIFNTLANGLIGYWPFSGNANDYSGIGVNGVVTGATLTTDKNAVANSAYDFSGTNQYITLGDNYDIGTSDFSASVWFRADALGSDLGIFGKMVYAAAARWGFGTTPTQVYFIWVSIGGTYYLPVNVSINNWYHIAVTIKRDGNMLFYLNGSQVGSVSVVASNGENANTANTTRFGAMNNSDGVTPSRFFNGKIDNGRIYNRVLTPDEVVKIYNDYL